MKRILLLIMLLFSISAVAQKKAKIKGDKNVTTEERTFDYFSKIEIFIPDFASRETCCELAAAVYRLSAVNLR